MSLSDVASYLEMTEDELFTILGLELLGTGLGVSPDDRSEARDYGRRWFSNRYSQLRRSICLHPKAKTFSSGSASDHVVDAAAIYELVVDLPEDPIKAAVIAVLVARIGLGTFCAGVSGAS